MKRKSWFRKNIPRIIPDVLAVCGAASLAYGTFQIWIPAGWIITGILFILSAIIWSKGCGGNDI